MTSPARSIVVVPQKKTPPTWVYEALTKPPRLAKRNTPYAQWAKVHDRKGYKEHLRLCDHHDQSVKNWSPPTEEEIVSLWEIAEEVWEKQFPKPNAELRMLGLAENTDYTKREIRNAYRRKARKLHPDVGGDAESFKQLYAAYRAVLKIARS